MLRSPFSLRLIATGALLLVSGLAHAQYSWIGENGVRHFSDRPPPPNTPPHKILKAPGHAPEPLPAAAPATNPASATTNPKPSLVQQEAAFQQRQKQRDEQEKKEVEDARRRVAQAERCEAARQVIAQNDAGVRVRKIDANGEHSIMTDQEKAALGRRAGQTLLECR